MCVCGGEGGDNALVLLLDEREIARARPSVHARPADSIRISFVASCILRPITTRHTFIASTQTKDATHTARQRSNADHAYQIRIAHFVCVSTSVPSFKKNLLENITAPLNHPHTGASIYLACLPRRSCSCGLYYTPCTPATPFRHQIATQSMVAALP